MSGRLGWRLFVTFVTVMLMSGCGSSSGPAGTQIAVVGDSYTTGPHDNPRDPDVWPQITWKQLRAEGYEIAPNVAGEGGAGYAHPGHLGGTFPDKAEAVQRSTEIVVFFGSANDMTVPPDTLRVAVRDTLKNARLTAPHAHLLVIGPAWPRPDVPREVWEVRDIVRDESVRLGASFTDPLDQRWLWDNPGLIGPDGIHPNREGQRYLAEKIRPLLEATLPTPAR